MKEINSTHIKLLQQHKGIIYAVLNRCHIYPQQAHFDDFFQIGQITFLTTLASYTKPYDTLNDWQIFVGYVSQKIYWRFLDELKSQRETKYDILSLNTDFLTHYQDHKGEDFIEQIEINNQIRHFRKTLTPSEIVLLDELLINGLTMTEYARKYHISRSTAYLHRNQLAAKYQKFDKNKN